MAGSRSYRLVGADGRELVSGTPGTLGGNRRTKVYGRLDCPVALSLIERGLDLRHRVFFSDEQTAVAAGYRPCGACLRSEYRAWKAGAHGRGSLTAGLRPNPADTEMHRAGGAFVRLSD